MRLNEVYNSGATEAQGIIRCTFVELFNAEGKKLYSVNRDMLGYNVIVVTNAEPTDKGMVEVAFTDNAAKSILDSMGNKAMGEKYQDLTSGCSLFVKETAVDWEELDESNRPSQADEEKQSKTMLYIGLGLLALSLIKK